MKVFGVEIRLAQAFEKQLQAVYATGAGWYNIVRESVTGAWQSNIVIDGPRELTAFSAVYACIDLISADIGKLGACLYQKVKGGTKIDVREATPTSPFLRVLTKPNQFQTWLQFIVQWMVMKLMYGNVYVFKEREVGNRKMVAALYVLDSSRITPLVADDGGVYYRLAADYLSGLTEPITVPASEIIHDRGVTLFHPLVGVTPIYACGVSTTMGLRIQANSTRFFGNSSQPGGQLTSPGRIDDETAKRLKSEFEGKFSGANAGRIFVAGNGLKYEAMSVPAVDAQLIEQLGWTVADVARCFHMPLWKIGADKEPLRQSVESLNQTYYSDCLQIHITGIQSLLNEGLELPPDYGVELNLEDLLMMDTQARYVTKGQAVKDGWLAPNEVRESEGYPPVPGGETPYLQQQNFSLSALAKRDAKDDPFATAKPPPPPPGDGPPPPDPNAAAKAVYDVLMKELLLETATLGATE
ncbi:MAG TPA: phage portal protein [Polyangia bacterium]|nr:phage portal protein [Polyangia bacterium]